ncbi:hypothetical protein [Glaciimonas sp. PCH181]|uniref:hypothetical protein n=1 Tax=Glaciimonas sp. PCH181 TaxID=2133943 RepID=UPI000D3B0EB7|nr:hypothetical protein [Glaciimonas sp. PCH181]PUA20454.1 hypothetical protein C7W93_12100 [Glaciimonas sp. PCH181]
MKPSKKFEAYVMACGMARLGPEVQEPMDVFMRRLWNAAEFDWFNQTRQKKYLLDGLDHAIDEAAVYRELIQIAIKVKPLETAGTANCDEYNKLFRAGELCGVLASKSSGAFLNLDIERESHYMCQMFS